jgi:hypothetical protein
MILNAERDAFDWKFEERHSTLPFLIRKSLRLVNSFFKCMRCHPLIQGNWLLNSNIKKSAYKFH